LSGFYRMPAFATLAVADPPSAARWYRDVFGFRIVLEVRQHGEAPDLVQLRRARYQDLLLVPDYAAFFEDLWPPTGGVRLTFTVEEDVAELAARARAAGAQVVEGPLERPWRTREVTFQDPDGYRLTFAQMSWIPGIL